MSGLFIRYRPSAAPTEPWRAVEVPSDDPSVDIPSLIGKDDAFSKIFPVEKIISGDDSAEKGASVGVVKLDALPPISSFYIKRKGGESQAYTTVVPGPISGGISLLGQCHKLRVYNEAIEAFISVDSISSNGCMTSILIESVPLVTMSTEITSMFKYSVNTNHQAAIDAHHASTGYKTEVTLQGEWSQQAVPTDRSGFSGKWKMRIRKGVPSTIRHYVLPTLMERCGSSGNQSLDDVCRWTYGWLPEGFAPMHYPTFGAQYISSLPKSIPLLSSGWLYQKYILTCLAQQQPDINACPMLPAVVSYLLLILNPNEAFATVGKMMQLSRRETISTIRYLPLSLEATNSFAASAIRIANNHGLHKTGFSPELLTVLFEDVCIAFFSQTFPHLYTLRILDMFVYEGIKILIRIFVGILRVYLPKLGDRDLTQFLVGGPSVSNSLFNTCTQTSFDAIIEEGFKLSLSKNDIDWSGAQLINIPKPQLRELQHWPRITDGPNACKILGKSLALYEAIYVYLPTQFTSITRVFRASEDGWAVSSLYAKASKSRPTPSIILFEMDDGLRGGVFTTEMPWKVSTKYTGSRNDFFFTVNNGLSGSPVTIYPCCGEAERQLVLLCESEYITIGDGPACRIGPGLQQATSSDCAVFSSPSLWKDSQSTIEVEAFVLE